MVYFIAHTWNSGFQLFRSDGTDAGTYVVKETGYGGYGYEFSAPMQLTEYNNKLFFSVDDGTGRRLWTSDGTTDGTSYAPGFNYIYMRTDYMSIYKNFPFRIKNNVLYISGRRTPYSNVGGLYKYDASNSDGIALVKDLAPEDADVVDYFVPVDVTIVNNKLILKVISTVNGIHDEIWTSTGDGSQTKLMKTFEPNAGVYTYNYYNANGKFYFVVHNNVYGNELWTSNGTDAGTFLVRDIYAGPGNSFPDDLTFCNGKLLFRAFNIKTGSELWSTDGTAAGTSLVKDINTSSTNSSFAGSNYFFKGIGASATGVVFNAVTQETGSELYKSDGTSAGTVLLNDIRRGEQWSYPNNFLFKNKVNYFIDDDSIGTALYKTNGTTAGLQKIIPYIDRSVYYVVNYNIADNGIAFYTLGNRFTSAQELWRSDGTVPGTFMLTASLSYYYNNYVAITGNTVFFIGGDFSYGYELWKSDGTIAGTKMVKDINPGSNGSDPYNLFIYKKQVYFGAWDGTLNYSLWKSDGTNKGTIKLKHITPAFYNSYFNTIPQQLFCESDGILYFSADDFNVFGAELWKTNGTEAGTVMVKDINPFFGSYPNNLTDVKGTLYFAADDGVNGNEIWKTNGSPNSTRLVKDITPGYSSIFYYNLCSAGGKLYFVNPASYPDVLWSSGGAPANTIQVVDEGLNGLSSFQNLTGVGDKLFFGAYSYKYGNELYVGSACGDRFSASIISSANVSPIQINEAFNAVLYPNPSHNNASLIIEGNASDVEVTITDIAGRIVWNAHKNNQSEIKLPVEKLVAGEYIIRVISGPDRKILKLVKQ
jgi:ELWxxDGT repeat protein